MKWKKILVTDNAVVVSMKNYFADMKVAAITPSKETMVKEKYRDWTEITFMSSPGITIDCIRNGH
jgi:hypothetical protein